MRKSKEEEERDFLKKLREVNVTEQSNKTFKY